MSQATPNTNGSGDYWRPGMDWFKPTLTPCQNDGCQNTFYRKAQTGRKYCDDCITMKQRNKIRKLRANR